MFSWQVEVGGRALGGQVSGNSCRNSGSHALSLFTLKMLWLAINMFLIFLLYTRSLGACWATTSSWWPFGPVWPTWLYPSNPRNDAWDSEKSQTNSPRNTKKSILWRQPLALGRGSTGEGGAWLRRMRRTGQCQWAWSILVVLVVLVVGHVEYSSSWILCSEL